MARANLTVVESSGHNLTPDSFVELYLELRGYKRALDEANAKYRAHRKRMEGAGINLKGLALVEQMAKLEDDEVRSRMQAAQRYAAWLDMPLGAQGILFPDPALSDAPGQKIAQALSLADAEEQGYEAGKRGDDGQTDNPFDNGSEAAVAWFDGWKRGQAHIAARMSMGEKPRKRASAPRKPRAAAEVADTRLGV